MADNIQTWREGSSGEPKFPVKFDVLKKSVLQVTDIETNRNKYYAIELHGSGNKFRVYTHYGRTDDLDSNPDAGIRECRYPSNLSQAEGLYDKIFKEKTSVRKGYKEVNLASTKIGSKQSVGKSSGEIDDKTIKKMAKVKSTVVKDPTPTITIHKEVQRLVTHLYDEATKTLTKKVNATVTADGIETPLGVLTIGQIDSGEEVLEKIAGAVKKKSKFDTLSKLSSEFYTIIPHKLGRSKYDVLESVIDSNSKINDKVDTLQLMRDMLNVSSKGQNILLSPQVEKQYLALGCEIGHLEKGSVEFKKIKKHTELGYGSLDIKNIFTIKRPDEFKAFTTSIKNQKLLFHGSGAHNWVGILSRGLMLPKMVTKFGVSRTDQGWLGHGIYFGDSIDTAMNYASSGKHDSTFIAIANVALGKMKDYYEITHGLTSAPKGYDSCHGNPDSDGTDDEYSEFDDHEFVIYDTKQQRLEYLLELE
jgi:poly [ADP-ribose] polymerase